MAIIAIFCDGTWNTFDHKDRTHVARFAESCAQTDTQTALYFEGVGNGTGMMSTVGRWLSKVGGGLFGWGLNRNIKAAYRALCELYHPGDKIMVFGFSRGAYTARSLVGMIRKCGILADTSPQNMRRAMQLYRRRGARNAPDEAHILQARRDLSPEFATSAADVIWRDDDSKLLRIAYVGVWDTVGALGIPKSVLGRIATLWNARYSFHDTSLSGLVEQARHAVALDEKRVLFEPGLWNNLDATDAGKGLNPTGPDAKRYYEQKWFVGSHGIVGGSVGPSDLATPSLQWIWEPAEAGGLTLKPEATLFAPNSDMAVPAPELYSVSWLYRWVPWLLQWRRGPDASVDLHETARARADAVADYRPETLQKILPALFRQP